MSKQKVILSAVAVMFISYGAASALPSELISYDLYADMHRSENAAATQEENQDNNAEQNQGDWMQQNEESSSEQINFVPKTAKDFYSFVPMKDLYVDSIDKSKYYSNPTVKSAIAKYKNANYTGCLQELYAYIGNPKNVNDAYAYYYMALAYSKVGESTAAKNCFQKTINCNATGKLLELAVKGRDCISGGAYCQAPINPTLEQLNAQGNSLDTFINAPYTGNGFSPEAQRDYQQRQLNNVQKKINSNGSISADDLKGLSGSNTQKKK